MNPTPDDIPATVKALGRLTVPALKQRYAEVFGEPTRTNHKQYLIKRISAPTRSARNRAALSLRPRASSLFATHVAPMSRARFAQLSRSGEADADSPVPAVHGRAAFFRYQRSALRLSTSVPLERPTQCVDRSRRAVC